MKADRKRLTLLVLLLVYAATLAVTGCGRVTPMGPDVDVVSAPNATHAAHATTAAVSVGLMPDAPVAGPAPEVEITPDLPAPVEGVVQPGGGGLSTSAVGFVQMVSKLVKPTAEVVLQTGRWSLDFHPGSLATKKVIRMSPATDGSLRIKFSPDGTQFGTPVDLTVDYAGTAYDPASALHVAGVGPVLVWLDPATGKWVEMPSTYDPATKKLHAQLQHFSTYGVSGRAGW